MAEVLQALSIWVLPVLLAITFHEAAHGWVAWQLGDDTAYRLGRVTFNPLRHIDPVGTVLLPALLLLASGGRFMFGFAKPVPVNFHRLRDPRRDMVLVAAAGPTANLLMALAAALLIHGAGLLPSMVGEWARQTLVVAVWINVLLAVFNMLPIPPLDGGRVAVGLLPPALSQALARLERVGIFIVLAVIFVLPWIGKQAGLDLNIFAWVVIAPASWLSEWIFRVAGVI